MKNDQYAELRALALTAQPSAMGTNLAQLLAEYDVMTSQKPIGTLGTSIMFAPEFRFAPDHVPENAFYEVYAKPVKPAGIDPRLAACVRDAVALDVPVAAMHDQLPVAWKVAFELFDSEAEALKNVRNPDLTPVPLYASPVPVKFLAVWETYIFDAMDVCFELRHKHGSCYEGAMVIDDTQIGVEFAIAKMKEIFGTAAPDAIELNNELLQLIKDAIRDLDYLHDEVKRSAGLSTDPARINPVSHRLRALLAAKGTDHG